MFRSTAAGIGLLAYVSIAACGSTEGSPAMVLTGAGGGQVAAGGSTAGTGAGGVPTEPVGPCTVTFAFTTVDNNGRYSPRNVSAVWVTDSQGAFVKTLEENGRIRQAHLVAWEAQTSGNTVDAITGATNSGPRAHTATWNCRDSAGNDVAPGSYTMHAEFTTSNTGGFFGAPAPLFEVPFDVGGSAYTLNPPDEPLFVSIELTYQ